MQQQSSARQGTEPPQAVEELYLPRGGTRTGFALGHPAAGSQVQPAASFSAAAGCAEVVPPRSAPVPAACPNLPVSGL
jgi:hypothetical protein